MRARWFWASIPFVILLGACGGGSGDPDAGSDMMTPSPTVEVTTSLGTLVGNRGTGYQEFLAIPYAQPPVGAARWRPPTPVGAWTEPRQARARAPRCPQNIIGLSTTGQEDCLYLNVHTPDPRPTSAAVMVWIHGGGFTLGEGVQTDNGTRGDQLAKSFGVVVVSMNYRLGALGFLSHTDLGAEQGAGLSGNYGLQDQVVALEWVRDHIAAFGGNPGNVTIFGESAGGASVCAHLASPESAGLFHRAIVQSGPCADMMTLVEGEAQGDRFAEALGCDTATDVVACMRAASATDVMATLPPSEAFIPTSDQNGRWGPVFDGGFFPDQPLARFAAGTFNQVPTIVGWTRDEGRLFAMLFERSQGGAAITSMQYDDFVAGMATRLATDVPTLGGHYPVANYSEPRYAAADLIGDVGIACPARAAARALADHVTTYAYRFDYPDANFQLPASFPLGAFHSAEIQFLFGHPARIGQTAFTNGDDVALVYRLMGYWTRFALTGDPNGGGDPTWPVYTSSGDTSLVIDRTLSTMTGADAADCGFLVGLGYP